MLILFLNVFIFSKMFKLFLLIFCRGVFISSGLMDGSRGRSCRSSPLRSRLVFQVFPLTHGGALKSACWLELPSSWWRVLKRASWWDRFSNVEHSSWKSRFNTLPAVWDLRDDDKFAKRILIHTDIVGVSGYFWDPCQLYLDQMSLPFCQDRVSQKTSSLQVVIVRLVS